MNQLSPQELKQWIEEQKDFALLDVREGFEHEYFNIGGTLMPLGELMQQAGSVEKGKPVVVYCEKGIRSIIAIQRLEGLGFRNLFNLTGGMKAWKEIP